jgi:hypothetical protein
MKPFTVILLMPDYHVDAYGETRTVHVMADTPRRALRTAQLKVVVDEHIEMPDPTDLHDLAGVAVFEGHLEDKIVEAKIPEPYEGEARTFDGTLGIHVREM